MIPAERAHLHVAAVTHPGMSGKNNEDRYAVAALRIEGERPLPVVFAVVSDGIGGHRAGEVAAETAVETMTQTIAQSDGTRPTETLFDAVQLASQAIYQQSQEDGDKHGMGATCACALVIDNRLFTISVGDSRIFLLSGGGIRQISIDHTWVQEALDAGLLTAEQVRSHPNAHVIRRYLGSPQVEPDLRLRLAPGENDDQMLANQGLQLEPGDQLLLCSDGLTDLVTPDEILATLKSNGQKEALEILSNLANQRGGHDNITIVALQMPVTVAELAPTIPLVAPKGRNVSRSGCMAGILAALLLAVVAAGGFLFMTGGLPGNDPTTVIPNTVPAATTAIQGGATRAATATATATRTPFAGTAAPSPSAWVTRPLTTAGFSGPTLTPWPTNTP